MGMGEKIGPKLYEKEDTIKPLKQTELKHREQDQTDIDESTEEEEDTFQRNPYLIFLNAIEDEDCEDEDEAIEPIGPSELVEFDVRKPWLNLDKYAKDPLSRKAEERVNKITSRYCSWLRQLPGEQQDETQFNEAHMKELFSHTVQSSTGTSKLAEGLRSWFKFGMVRKTEKVGRSEKFRESQVEGEQAKGVKRPSSQNQKANPLGNSKQRHLYGAWYLDPQDWNKRYKHQMKLESVELAQEPIPSKLCASLPGQVNMLGASQPVSDLHSTKAFRNYLEKKSDYTQPTFIKYIFKAET